MLHTFFSPLLTEIMFYATRRGRGWVLSVLDEIRSILQTMTCQFSTVIIPQRRIANIIFFASLQHMKSVLECLSQLHGTGFAFKKHSGGKQKILETFPKLEVQIQLQVLVDLRNRTVKTSSSKCFFGLVILCTLYIFTKFHSPLS